MYNYKIYIILLSVIIIFNNCEVQKISKIQNLGFIIQTPITTMDDDTVKLTNFLDTIFLFKKMDIRLYKLRPAIDINTNKNVSSSESYFIYKENSSYGYFFKNPYKNIDNYQKKQVDSVLPEHAYTKIDMRTDTSKMPFYSKTTNNDGTIIEKYIGKDTSEFAADSAYYYFTNKDFNNTEMSLSPTLDSIVKMKLYKVRLILNKKFSTKYQVTFPKRECLFELIKFPYAKDTLVEKLFAKFEQLEISKMN